MKPIIGITGNYNYENDYYWLKRDYVASINEAGGTAIILPPVDDDQALNHYINLCNGFLFSGGGDMDPSYWQEEPESGLGEINPLRDRFEYKLIKKILGTSVPILGICRGCQILNVSLGGSLIQDLDSGYSHQQNAPRDYTFHAIIIKEGSILAKIVKKPNIRVNSFHHQAIKKLGQGLKVSAVAPDGTTEAIESQEHPFVIGVQWHPECLTDKYSTYLFKALIENCMLTCR
ncbi:MAG TPA: gamma-glutamyl-gamma-aminobutyrate hydrolase family protein [Syntrophomonadaceae bacterium]|nr:gamma-glutamyl-gamma-aminobutyrate hydrolase family protein [Syntrophomonadaceae bacterium]